MGAVEARPFAVPEGAVVRDRRPRLVSKANTARSLLPLLWPPARGVAYVGWLGHDNLGDEAMFRALRLAFPDWRLAAPPRDPALARLNALARGRLFDAGMLGGGTLIGWRAYREALERLVARCGDLPLFMLGTGVLDPRFDYGPGSPDLADELPRWAETLRRFHRIAVRGPRSRELLEDLGLEAYVVGDTALLLADDEPTDRVEEGLLGLNVGIARSIWGNDPEGVLDEVVLFAREMVLRGWRIRLVPVWPRDLPYVEEAAQRIGPAAEILRGYLDLETALAALRRCHVFVGLKLHSVVLASAVYVPSIMLDYQPKCTEFQASVGREEYTVRTDRVSAPELVEKVEELAKGSGRHRQLLAARVGPLRDRLRAEAAGLQRSLER